jgi:excisionase family DNA binding protein
MPRLEFVPVRTAEDSPWLSVKSAARYLDTTPDAIRGLVKRRQIPFRKAPNGRLLFDGRELDRWIRGEAA